MFGQEDLLDAVSQRPANALGHVGQHVVAGLLLVWKMKVLFYYGHLSLKIHNVEFDITATPGKNVENYNEAL